LEAFSRASGVLRADRLGQSLFGVLTGGGGVRRVPGRSARVFRTMQQCPDIAESAAVSADAISGSAW
jgi:hypothetical protein